ncbi:MAG: cytochrome P450 [Rhodobiaceae bacterium]|nr:cytochrome P450 [Rhodobiaceae bacterium]
MQLLSEIIQPEDNSYRPPHIAYETPEGFDLMDMTMFRDHGQPYDYFHTLREKAPVSWWQPPATTDVAGFWALTRYEDVKKCDLDAKTFSSGAGGILMGYSAKGGGPKRLAGASLNSMINLDQPWHIPLRMAHRPFFTPDYIGKLQSRVETEVDRLLDNMEAIAKKNDGKVDMVTNFSEWLPMYTLCEMLGIDEKDRPSIVRWMHYLENAAYIVGDPESKVSPWFIAKFLWNIRQMFRYGQKVLLDRRKNPRDDLLTVIATTELDGEPMDPSYLDGSWLLIIFAGNDTTRNSLSGTMRLLSQFKDQKQMLIDEPALIPQMVPEALRLVSPVMYMRRMAQADAELSGQKITKGEKVVMYYGAANRDPDVFADPDKMDIQRNNANEHLAFGTGAHVCLGQRIANMQLETAYARILDRYPNIEWTGKQAHAPNNFVNAISHLEVNLGI